MCLLNIKEYGLMFWIGFIVIEILLRVFYVVFFRAVGKICFFISYIINVFFGEYILIV